jgi:hypothetical protein
MAKKLDEDGFPKGLHYCPDCLGWYAWNHSPVGRSRLFFRKLLAVLTGRFRIRIEFD